MNIRSLVPSLLPLLPLVLVACGDGSSDSAMSAPRTPEVANPAPATTPGSSGTTGDAARAIAEADIVQLDNGHLFALSKQGTLSIIDVSKPGQLTMLGQLAIAGEPFEMYVRESHLVVMTNGAYDTNGSSIAPLPINGHTTATPIVTTDHGAGVVAVDIGNLRAPKTLTTFPIPGTIADSRIIGNILYLATYETTACWGCGSLPRTVVTSFDVTDIAAMRRVEMLAYEENDIGWNPDGFKRSVYATDQRLYVGGHNAGAPNGTKEGAIDVLDISDPAGHLKPVVRFITTGAITARWQMDEKDGVFRVVSQRGAGYTSNGFGMPAMETFTVGATYAPNGIAPMTLPRAEALKTVRFDGPRAYAITFANTDPLFILDFSDAQHPKQRGSLTMPGYLFYLEPHGDRLLGLGLDGRDSRGHLNVSLVDVSNADFPVMLERVPFGSTGFTSNDAIATYELPEDQDRIQKAFRVLDGGLIVAPFAGSRAPTTPSSTGDVCAATAGGVELISWKGDVLAHEGTLAVEGNPRRALLNDGELLAVSDSHVTAFDRTSTRQTADLVIGTCETRSSALDVPVVGNGDVAGNMAGTGPQYGYYDDDVRGPFACSFGRGSRAGNTAGLALVGLALAGAALCRRRAVAK